MVILDNYDFKLKFKFNFIFLVDDARRQSSSLATVSLYAGLKPK